MFWSLAAVIWSPGELRSSPGYSLIWRMPRAFVPGSMIHAAQAKPMSAMPSSVFSPGGVVVFDLDAAGAEFGHLGADVADLPRRLGLLVGGPGGALGHVQVGAAAAAEHDGVLVLPYDLQPELAGVELPRCGEAGG